LAPLPDTTLLQPPARAHSEDNAERIPPSPGQVVQPIDLGVTTGFTSLSPAYFAVEPLIFALHMEFPEVVPLPIEVGGAQVQHGLSA